MSKLTVVVKSSTRKRSMILTGIDEVDISSCDNYFQIIMLRNRIYVSEMIKDEETFRITSNGNPREKGIFIIYQDGKVLEEGEFSIQEEENQ